MITLSKRILRVKNDSKVYLAGQIIHFKVATYKRSPLSKFAPECHLNRVSMPCPLVKGLAGLEGRAVQVQTDSALSVADVLHTMQAQGIYTNTQGTHIRTNIHSDWNAVNRSQVQFHTMRSSNITPWLCWVQGKYLQYYNSSESILKTHAFTKSPDKSYQPNKHVVDVCSVVLDSISRPNNTL